MKLKIAILSLLASTILSAASIDYLSNNSASFFQNPSQTGKISVEGIFTLQVYPDLVPVAVGDICRTL